MLKFKFQKKTASLYFYNKKTHVVFFVFHFEQLSFIPNEKNKVAQNEKRKKLHGFSYYKKIANFEAFSRDKNFSKDLLFLGSESSSKYSRVTRQKNS